MRDAGLSIKTWLEVNDNDLSLVKPEVDAYVDWVGVVQNKPDPNVDVRVEPKFYIPSGDPYDGGWCRPQTDGPALRAMALAKYGMMLNDAGEDTSNVWDRIKFDMEWVVPNWDQNGCDLCFAHRFLGGAIHDQFCTTEQALAAHLADHAVLF